MFKEIWQWWMAGLGAPWPHALRRYLAVRTQRWRVEPLSPGFSFSYRKGRRWNHVAGSGEDHLPPQIRKRVRARHLTLLLPKENALVRSISTATNSVPENYIESMLDEVSPLPADDRYFDSIEIEKGSTLVIARRSFVDGLCQELTDRGIEVDSVSVAGFEDSPLDLAPERPSNPGTRLDFPGLALTAVGLLLCAVAIVMLTEKQNVTLSSLESKQRLLQAELQGAQPIRDQVGQLKEQVAAIAARRGGHLSTLSLLASVTRAVPDHTWIRNWVLNGEHLTLFGESTDTAALIAVLEASPELRDVRYQSAITRDPESGKDRFRISAMVDKL